MNTYILSKVAINNANYKSQKQKDDMQLRLDVFLLNDRIAQSEYEELVVLLSEKSIS